MPTSTLHSRLSLAGGILGLERRSDPGPSLDIMAWALPGDVTHLPKTLSQAADALAADTDLRTVLGSELANYWVGTRRWEWLSFHLNGGDPDAGVSEWELRATLNSSDSLSMKGTGRRKRSR